MTAVAVARARIVTVAIRAQKPQIDLFQFFWRELKLIGARPFEPEDYEKAIEAIASGAITCEALIADVTPLADIQSAFESLDTSLTATKSLIKVSRDA